MSTLLKISSSFALCAGLASCGGISTEGLLESIDNVDASQAANIAEAQETTTESDGDSDAGAEIVETVDSFNETAHLQELIDTAISIETAAIWAPYTDTVDMPTTGTGTYEGALSLTFYSAFTAIDTVIGEMEANVDFTNNTVSGAVDRVSSITLIPGTTTLISSSPHTGSLTISNGEVISDFFDEGAFTADLDGELGRNGGSTSVDAELYGVFLSLDDHGDTIIGSASGSFTSDNLGPTSGIVSGGFTVQD